MARLSPGLRELYRAPEAVCAAALFVSALDRSAMTDPMEALQVFRIEEHKWPGEVMLKLWLRLKSGREMETSDRYQLRGDGWGVKAFELGSPVLLGLIRERLDPATGNYIGPRITLPPPQP